MVTEATKIEAKVVNGINVDDLLDLIDDVKQNAAKGRMRSRTHVDGFTIGGFGGKENVMKATIDARDESRDNYREQELTEERFLEQFAALEESLALLQARLHSISENAKLFASLARHIRRSACPTTGHQDKIRADCVLGQLSSDHI
jgi:hypothetical protein